MYRHLNPYLFVRTITLLACIAVGQTNYANAQESPTSQSKSLELEQVERNISQAIARQTALREEIERYDQDLNAINRALIQTAKRGQELESAVAGTEAELQTLEGSQQEIRQSLGKKRKVLSEIIGALQRMGRNPPPAIFVTPEDALASIRSSILLSNVVPEIKSETDILFAELSALRRTSVAINRKKLELADQLNALGEDESRLTLLIDEKNQLARKSRSDLDAEQQRATELASKALSLKELINTLESKIASAAAAAEAAKQADAKRKSDEEKRLAEAKKSLGSSDNNTSRKSASDLSVNIDRIEPSIAFSRAKKSILTPVSGVNLYNFGDKLPNRDISTVAAFASRPNARVRSPIDGWVIYAGPFRSYGQVLILNAGENYHMVLSGLAEVNVQTGRFVLAGEPVGRMGESRFAATVSPQLGSNKPVLSVELRKDGKSIDVAPWWAPVQVNNRQLSSNRSVEEGSDNDS